MLHLLRCELDSHLSVTPTLPLTRKTKSLIILTKTIQLVPEPIHNPLTLIPHRTLNPNTTQQRPSITIEITTKSLRGNTEHPIKRRTLQTPMIPQLTPKPPRKPHLPHMALTLPQKPVQHIPVNHGTTHPIQLPHPASGKSEHPEHDSSRTTIGKRVKGALNLIKRNRLTIIQHLQMLRRGLLWHTTLHTQRHLISRFPFKIRTQYVAGTGVFIKTPQSRDGNPERTYLHKNATFKYYPGTIYYVLG